MALMIGAAILASCAPAATPTVTPDVHAGHDQQTVRVMSALEAEGLTFEPAGPHHTLGRGQGGVELDLIGVPVEEVILSLPADDVQAGLDYLPHLRDLLHGPDPVYDWVAAMLACRSEAGRTCAERFEQGNLAARFSDGGPDFVVLTLSRP